MTDYLAKYGTRKFQAGGPVPGGDPMAALAPTEGAPAGGGGELEQMLMQVVQTQDPQLALQFCNMLAQTMGLGQAAAPAGAPAEGGVPMGRRGMILQPRFRKGGKL